MTRYCLHRKIYYKYYQANYKDNNFESGCHGWPEWCKDRILTNVSSYHYYLTTDDLSDIPDIEKINNHDYIVEDIETKEISIWSYFSNTQIIEECDLPYNIKVKLGIKAKPEIADCRFCSTIPKKIFARLSPTKYGHKMRCDTQVCGMLGVSTGWKDTEEQAINCWNYHMEVKSSQ